MSVGLTRHQAFRILKRGIIKSIHHHTIKLAVIFEFISSSHSPWVWSRWVQLKWPVTEQTWKRTRERSPGSRRGKPFPVKSQIVSILGFVPHRGLCHILWFRGVLYATRLLWLAIQKQVATVGEHSLQRPKMRKFMSAIWVGSMQTDV